VGANNATARLPPLTGALVTDETGTLFVRRIRVRVTSGPDRGREAMLEAGTLLVGTHQENDLVLRDLTVGKYHLELALVAGGVRVRDVGSESGTTVAGVRIVETMVSAGSEVCVGRSSLQLIVADLPVATPPSERPSFGPVLGNSPKMRSLFALLERVAPTESPLLIEGEPGAGLTLVAKAVHAASAFAASPIVVIDFSAKTTERGSIQQIAQRNDRFTVLIEHLDQAPASSIADLLTLYNRREQGALDARIVATTAPGLRSSPTDSRDRRELLAHAAAVRLVVPPLRDRLEDLPVILAQLCRDICGVDPQLSQEDFKRILARPYPGNVRELKQILVKCLAQQESSRPQLPPVGLARARAALVFPLNVRPKPLDLKVARERVLDAFEREWFQELFSRKNGDLSAIGTEALLSDLEVSRLVKKYALVPATLARAPSESPKAPNERTSKTSSKTTRGTDSSKEEASERGSSSSGSETPGKSGKTTRPSSSRKTSK